MEEMEGSGGEATIPQETGDDNYVYEICQLFDKDNDDCFDAFVFPIGAPPLDPALTLFHCFSRIGFIRTQQSFAIGLSILGSI